jgi:transposase
MAMDKAYEGDETRTSVTQAGFSPVVPPKHNRKEPWEYDEELYKRRNEVERLFLGQFDQFCQWGRDGSQP